MNKKTFTTESTKHTEKEKKPISSLTQAVPPGVELPIDLSSLSLSVLAFFCRFRVTRGGWLVFGGLDPGGEVAVFWFRGVRLPCAPA
jgi:hypothetical protein